MEKSLLLAGHLVLHIYIHSRRVPVEWKSSVCLNLICMKYRIIILIIIIISLGQILLSYIANTSHTHARMRMHARTRAHACASTLTHTAAAVEVSAIRWHPTVWPTPLAFVAGSRVIEINTRADDPVYPIFWMFFAYKKLLGRTETRTRDRICFQTLRTVRDISRDDWARIATCSLRTPTDLRRIIV